MYDDLSYIEDYDGEIEVVAYWNNREKSLGSLRQALVEEAKGDYICFVDDDDMLPEYYLSSVYSLLGGTKYDGPQYVGWKMQYIHDGVPSPKPTYHSLKYDGWSEDSLGFYRDVSHLNPVRRSLALRADFRKEIPGVSEDRSWAIQLRPHLATEE